MMEAEFPISERVESLWMPLDASQMSRDLRRMLSIQFREFIHHIEDSQNQDVLECNPRVISFLERCYEKAA